MKTFSKFIALTAICLVLFAACKTKGQGSSKVAGDFLLEIQHAGCRGNCPAYSMKVDAKGNANFVGRHAVEMMGSFHKTIPMKTVELMSQAIQDAHFFDFDDVYGGEVADVPGITTYVQIDGKTKKVNDIRNGPKELKDLEAKLEDYFGKEGWTQDQ